MESTPAVRDSGGVGSVGKSLAILEYVGLSGPSTLADIAAHAALPKSTLFRLLATMVDAGFLERRAHGEYAVTLKTWRIGAHAIDHDTVHAKIVSALHELVAETGETAHYSKYEEGFAVYVEKVDGLHPIRAYSQIGGLSPAHASATGKALLAWQQADEIARVAERAERHTPATLQGGPAIESAMAAIRREGFAVNRGEWRADVWGVAAPIFDRLGRLTGAIGVSGPRGRIEPAVEDHGALVRSKAEELSLQQGAEPTTGTRAG